MATLLAESAPRSTPPAKPPPRRRRPCTLRATRPSIASETARRRARVSDHASAALLVPPPRRRLRMWCLGVWARHVCACVCARAHCVCACVGVCACCGLVRATGRPASYALLPRPPRGGWPRPCVAPHVARAHAEPLDMQLGRDTPNTVSAARVPPSGGLVASVVRHTPLRGVRVDSDFFLLVGGIGICRHCQVSSLAGRLGRVEARRKHEISERPQSQ